MACAALATPKLYHLITYSIFLVYIGDLVWVGLLLLHRLALAGARTSWLYGCNQLIHTIPDCLHNRNQRTHKISGYGYRHRIFSGLFYKHILNEKKMEAKSPKTEMVIVICFNYSLHCI